MRGFDREAHRSPYKDLKLAAAVALVSFGAGFAWSSVAEGAAAEEPELDDVACRSDCDGDAASIGSTVELTGTGLGLVEKVKFTSAEERRAKARPERVTGKAVEVVVPEGAITGPPRVVDSERNKSTSPVDLEISGTGEGTAGEAPPPEEDPATPTDPDASPPGDTSPDGISVDPDKGFFLGKRQATAHLGGGSVSELEVVSAADGTTVATLPVEDAVAGAETTVSWDGITDSGEVAPNGEYEFRAGSSGDSAAFEQYDHIFPVNGKHKYGDGLGAGRNHQGQDVFADCGTKLVAARAGKVEISDSHSAAGNYIVIDGKKTGTDHAYMHLQEPSLFAEGDKVKTGEAIGHVGESGNASGCHLHFEVWDSGYQEGKVGDPTTPLKEWDEYS